MYPARTLSPDNAANVVGALAFALSDSIRAVLAQSDRDHAAAAALIHLSKYPGQTIDALRAPLGLTHSGCVRLVDRLSASGHVERRAGPDGRSVGVHATGKGRRLARRALDARARALDSALGALSPAELDTFGRIAAKMVAHQRRAGGEPLRVCRACDYDACRVCPMDDEPEPRERA
jgi:DNA-binding MarR family transcriptional regulator